MAMIHMRPKVMFSGMGKQETLCHRPRLVARDRSVYSPMLATCPRCLAKRE